MGGLTIGQLAKKAGVNVGTIRYYERRGLIPEPPRSSSGYRQYSQEAIARIRFIKRAKELGFSLREISELLSLRVEPDTTCGDVRRRAEAKLIDIERKIEALGRMKRALMELIASCQGRGPISECPILEALNAEEEEEGGEGSMAPKRKVEIFSAGCPVCEEVVELVNRIACPACEVSVLDVKDAQVARRARELGIRSVPAVVIDGKLAPCCAGRGPDEARLREAGLGQPA